jgi:transcriptional regulator with PAS, ATPase and Fis domain
MQDIFHILERVSGTNLPVLIQGDSGTGKEIIANAIHRASPRRAGRFISENCAALSETILESELFGHNRGAFTGAVADRKGLFELAHGGTLFLDEVGDMSLTMQKKLLRVLEEGEIRRVGGKDTIRVDVRILSASNRNLRALTGAGKFREDLFYRLNGIQIDLPALRERKDDIPLLVQHFLDSIARESHQSPKTVSPGALRLLLSYDWPGNVRELRHFLERTVLLAPGQRIEERDCLFDPVIFRQEGSVPQETLLPGIDELPLRSARDGFIKHYIERAYVRHGHNVTRAAKACGISRESFHRFLKRLRIKPKRERRGGDH